MAKPKTVEVERKGDQIILPPGMSYKDARDWLVKQEEAEETKVAVADNIECFPLDGMVALSRALNEIYGFTSLTQRSGFFGPEPPLLIQVPTVEGFETAPMGRMKPPKWEGGYVEAQVNGPTLYIGGVVKRKFEHEVKRVIALTRDMLKTRSIYRGQAIHLDLTWMWNDPNKFDVFKDAPKFMDLSGEVSLLLNEETDFGLKTNVLALIERGDFCARNGISRKHGALFKGPYGTGKTLTSKLIAQKAVANEWTFIYLQHAYQLAAGLKLAKLYAPAVVFVEDVDTVVTNRNQDMNELLNTLDGVDTKTCPIIAILTTNHAEAIHPSFLRAGRIDTVLHFSEPDAPTAIKLVKHMAGKDLDPKADLTAVGEAFAGIVPAFICEAVSKAKRYTNYRTGKDNITGLMTPEDLLKAAASAKAQVQMMSPKTETEEQKLAASLEHVHNWGIRGFCETNGYTIPVTNNGNGRK